MLMPMPNACKTSYKPAMLCTCAQENPDLGPVFAHVGALTALWEDPEQHGILPVLLSQGMQVRGCSAEAAPTDPSKGDGLLAAAAVISSDAAGPRGPDFECAVSVTSNYRWPACVAITKAHRSKS